MTSASGLTFELSRTSNKKLLSIDKLLSKL